jgi:hypothetical protein
MMKLFIVAGLVAGVAMALPASAQNAPTGPAPTMSTPASPTQPQSSAPTTTGTGAVAGANSFTETQARRRLEQNGYSQVSSLVKGKDGIWRGTAMKNGASGQVSVDYKGDISMD